MSVSWIVGLAAPLASEPNERRPSSLLVGLESRAWLEWASIPMALPWLMTSVSRGDGHAVLVLPGLMASDVSTRPLRQFLRAKGYDVAGWRQGRNFGPRRGVIERMEQSLHELHQRSGRKVSIVGWSLGGIYARELARAFPDLVRQVITLGSPLYGDPETSTNAWDLYRVVSDREGDDSWRRQQPPPVPMTSIYTRGDGVVGWGCSVERASEQTDNIEINSATHMGLGVNPLVWYAVGDRLALPEDGWRKFAPRGLTRALFPFRSPLRA